MFEVPAKNVVGLERLMLEASGFDYRSRHPQRLLLKLAKQYALLRPTALCAYNICLDLYRTFAPLKQTTPTMAIACLELAGRLCQQPIADLEAGKGYKKWRTSRPEVMETMMDLLELYTHHRASTIVGQDHAVDVFIAIRITLNQESTAEKYPRFTNMRSRKSATNGSAKPSNGAVSRTLKNTISPISPRDPLPAGGGSGKANGTTPAGGNSATNDLSPGSAVRNRAGFREGTVRFMLDGERARREKKVVEAYFRGEEEEVEVEG
jgi:CTD kinase subunit beta